MKKFLNLLVVFLFVLGYGFPVTAADQWTSGDTTNGWTVESDGDFVPDQDSTSDIGASGYEVSSIYVDTLVVGGDTVTGASQLATPMEDQGTYVQIQGDSDVKLYDNGNIVITGDMDADSYIMENDAQLDNASDNSVTLTENSDVTTFNYDGDDLLISHSDGSIELKPEADATEGTVDIFAGGDTDDYVEFILSTTDKPSINFNGCDGIITASGGDISFGDENLLTTGTFGCGALTATSVTGFTSVTFTDDVLSLSADDTLEWTSNDEAAYFLISGYTGKDAVLQMACNDSAASNNQWNIYVDYDDNNLEIFNETTELIDIASGGNIDMVAGTTLTMGNDEYFSNATNGTMQAGSSSDMIFEVYSSGTSDSDATLTLQGDAGADATDRWDIINDTGAHTLIFKNDSATAETMVTKLTIAASDGDITTTGDIEIVDDMDLVIGTGGDWKIQYDEGVDDQLLIVTTATGTGLTDTDASIQILFPATCDADQDLFEIGRGADQSAPTALFTVDEDGDVEALGTITLLANGEILGNASDAVVTVTSDDSTGCDLQIIGADGDTTSDAKLTLDADAGGDNADTWIIESEANGNDFTINNHATEVFNLTTAGTLQIDGDFSADGGDVTFSTATDTKPVVLLESTHADANSGELRFEKDSATPADNDDLGRITFYSDDSGGASSAFAYILAEATDITATKEAGSIEISMEINDTDTNFVKFFGDAGDVTTGHIEFNQDTADIDFHYDGNTTADYLLIDATTETTKFESSVTNMPLLVLENATNDTTDAELKFIKDKGAAGADNDTAGTIYFAGDDDAEAETQWATIEASVSDASNGDEAGKLDLSVMMDDTSPALKSMIMFEGMASSTPGEGQMIFNDDSEDVDITFETDTNATFLVIDSGTDVLTMTASTTTDPQLILVNTTNDTTAPTIQFKMDKGAAGADGDDSGTILFTGDDAAQTQTDMAKILAEVDEADDGNEAGSLTFQVMFDDGTPALKSFLVLEGQAASTAGQGIIEINSSADDVDTQISTVDDASFFTVDAGTGDSTLTLTSATASNPIFNITNTNTDANCAVMNFRKDGEDEADGDDLGRINFYGNDSGNNDQIFAYILAESADITDTAEAGKISVQLEVADTDTAFLGMFADAAASTAHFEINSGAADIDFHLDGNDQADLISTNADTDTINLNPGQADSQILITQGNTTGTANEELIFINDDRTGGNADSNTEATIVIDAEGSHALYVSDGVAEFADTCIFAGGQTRKEILSDSQVILDGTNPPATTDLGSDGTARINAWSFDGNGANGDDLVYLNWRVPDGYVADSARLNIGWSYSNAETDNDDVVFDMTVKAVAPGTAAAGGEAWNAAGTAFTEGDTNITNGDGDEGKLIVTQLDFEVADIAVDDLVIIKFWVDESESDLDASGTLDVHFFEIEWESTE